MKDNEQLQYENEQLAQGNNKLWTQLEKSAEILSHHEAYISLLEEENKELKNLLKEIRGKLHYINTPKNQHNIFGNDFMKKLDDLFKAENEE